MRRKLAFAYGIFCYVAGLVAILYAIGFLANFLVPQSIDTGSMSGPVWQALVIDILLISAFAIQHSVMSRAGFKRWWQKIVPQPVQRSTFVLFASLTLGLIFWQWQPIPVTIWNIEPVWGRWPMWGLYGLGWVTVFASAEMINGGHLFGRQQVTQYLRGKSISAPKFQTPGLYRYVRHPLMLGFIVAFFATPHMTVGHLVFSLTMTVYIVIGLQFEERALLGRFGPQYEVYREQVPMLIPRLSPLQVDVTQQAETSPSQSTAR